MVDSPKDECVISLWVMVAFTAMLLLRFFSWLGVVQRQALETGDEGERAPVPLVAGPVLDSFVSVVRLLPTCKDVHLRDRTVTGERLRPEERDDSVHDTIACAGLPEGAPLLG